MGKTRLRKGPSRVVLRRAACVFTVGVAERG